jgi:3-oxoacyl-[acyl-carrier protein] reductase
MSEQQQSSAGILDLTGRVGLVTGAGQGVGRQVALNLAHSGARAVVVNDYRLERAEAVAAEVEQAGSKAVPVQADVSDFDSVSAMFEEALAAVERIDLLVNNAGNAGPTGTASLPRPFAEQSPEEWPAYLGTNLHGVLHCTRLALPGMQEARYGRVVTVISDAGRVGEAGLELYAAAKAGAAGFMRSLARSVGRYEITANCVSLGATRTPFVADALEDEERAKQQLKRYVIRRFGTPEDAAGMILFLCSDAGGWITGQTIPVNGGYSFAL